MNNLSLINLFKKEIKNNYFIEKFIVKLISKNNDILYIEDILKSYDSIKKNKRILAKNNTDIFKSNTFEELNDKIEIIISTHKLHQLIFKNISTKHHEFIDDEIQSLCLPLVAHENSYIIFKNLFKKISLYQNTTEFKNYIRSELIHLSSFNMDKIQEDIFRTNAKIIFKDTNKLLVEITSYEDSLALGSSKWCISYSKGMYDSYRNTLNRSRYNQKSVFDNSFNKFIFLYDFHKSISDPDRLIGYTINSNSEILYSMDCNDHPTSINNDYFNKYKHLINFKLESNTKNEFLFNNNIKKSIKNNKLNLKNTINDIFNCYDESYLDRYITIHNFDQFKNFNTKDLSFNEFISLKFNDFNTFSQSYKYFKLKYKSKNLRTFFSTIEFIWNKFQSKEHQQVDAKDLPEFIESLTKNFKDKTNIPKHIYDNITHTINSETNYFKSDFNSVFSLLESSNIHILNRNIIIENDPQTVYKPSNKNTIHFLKNNNIEYETNQTLSLILTSNNLSDIYKILRIRDHDLWTNRSILTLQSLLKKMEHCGEKLTASNVRSYGDFKYAQKNTDIHSGFYQVFCSLVGFNPNLKNQPYNCYAQYGYIFMGISQILNNNPDDILKINISKK
jgi:hypothetical protein